MARMAAAQIPYDEVIEKLSNSVLRIFNFTKKRDLEKYCKNETISSDDLFNVIMACDGGKFPWRRKTRYRDFVPEHLVPRKEDRERMTEEDLNVSSPVPKYLRKIMSIFDERRYLVGHLFYTPDQGNWHMLYFDQRDTSPRRNHWGGGSHIHVFNYLCTQDGLEKVWRDFNDGNPTTKGLHIRWADREREPFGA